VRNALYAQAGGVTAVINASAAGVIAAARRHPDQIGRIFAAQRGIRGIWDEALIDTSVATDDEIARLRHTPGGAFGSYRYDLRSHEEVPAVHDRIFEVLAAHDIGYLFYNGGNGSMDTAWKLHCAAIARGYPLVSIGIPKTIDNDLALTDCCPGYGSAAKYVGTAIREAGLDLEAMVQGQPKIFLMEVMGRNTGWIAAASMLASERPDDAPHLVLLPERAFEPEPFLARVKAIAERLGWCAIVVAEGLRDDEGRPLAARGNEGGYELLGGAGQVVARLIEERLGYRYHLALPDYLQRVARHIASKTDVEQAYAVGEAAVGLALEGRSGVMPAIERLSDSPYRWQIGAVALREVANLERCLPPEFIAPDGMGVTGAFRRYAEPLIEGEDAPAYRRGLPDYARIGWRLVAQRCGPAASVLPPSRA
jgi:6-phosphofructokinase 1